MENYEWSKQIEPPSGGLGKLRASLQEEELAERDEMTMIRYVVAALLIAVITLSFARMDLPERQSAGPVRSDLMAGNKSISPVRVYSQNAAVSRLSGLTQKVQIFWMSPTASAESAE